MSTVINMGDNSKKDITQITTITFLKDVFRHAYAIIILIE